MNSFDIAITSFVNQFSQNSWLFDKFVASVAGNSLLKGGVLVAVIWWAWFEREDRYSHNRKHIIATLVGSIVAMAFAKGLTVTLPFRLRPMDEERMRFLLPHEWEPEVLSAWSSFPSDHAVLFFSLSAGLLFAHRRVGMLAILYTALVIAFPRLYLGLHYATDIIGGAVVGIAFAVIANTYLVENKYVRSIVDLSASRPSLFYPVFFVFAYQIADNFAPSRALARGAFVAIQSILG